MTPDRHLTVLERALRGRLSTVRAASATGNPSGLGACNHTTLRAVTSGGRCPICEPRTDGLAPLEQAITDTRVIRRDAELELVQRGPNSGSSADLHAQIAALNAEIAEAEAEIKVGDAALGLTDLGQFGRLAWHEVDTSGRPYVPNPGTDAIVRHLQALADNEIALLGLAVSPGFGKSSWASVLYPAFQWARNPSWRVICASYAMDLSIELAKRFYRVVTSDWYRGSFPQSMIDRHGIKAIATAKGGTRYAVGVTGALTGIRADGGVIDDSLNAIDANNIAAVREVNTWFQEAFFSRFDQRGDSPPGVAVIQQRLNSIDLIALIRSLGGTVLELPAMHEVGRQVSTIYWKDERTEEGQVLAPEIHSQSYLEDRRRVLGPRAFASQYQQRPAPRDGNQFKASMWSWHTRATGPTNCPRPDRARAEASTPLSRRKDMSLDLDWVCVSIDASNGGTGPDASALGIGVIGGIAGSLRRAILEDHTDGPKTWLQTLRQVGISIVRAGAIAGKQKRFVVLLEKKAMGASEDAPLPTQIRAALKKGRLEYTDEGGARQEILLQYPDGSPIVAKLELYEPSGKGSKAQRADHLEPDLDAGLISVEDGAAWVPAFVEEFGLFGGSGGRDDRVDIVSQCIDHFRVVKDPKDRFRAMAR